MSKAEIAKLEVILGKIETLQNQTYDRRARDMLGRAKDELLRLLRASE